MAQVCRGILAHSLIAVCSSWHRLCSFQACVCAATCSLLCREDYGSLQMHFGPLCQCRQAGRQLRQSRRCSKRKNLQHSSACDSSAGAINKTVCALLFFVALRRRRREASPPHQLLNTTRGALRPRPGQLGLHLLRGHRLLHIRARGKRRQRFHTLLHPMGGALLFYSVPLGEIQHWHLVFALGIRRQPSGEEDNTHRASAMVAVKRKKSDLLGFVSFQTISLIYVITSVVGVETWYKPILFNFLYRDLFTLMIVGKRRLLPYVEFAAQQKLKTLIFVFQPAPSL